MIEEGRPASELELTSDSGETVSLSSLLGKPAVLCFYPKEEIADENEMNAYGMDGPSPKALTEAGAVEPPGSLLRRLAARPHKDYVAHRVADCAPGRGTPPL